MISPIISICRIKDLSCNNVVIKPLCVGSLEIATIPPEADIYIYDEIQGDYVLKAEKTGSIDNPIIIPNIECTGPTRSNKFKLSKPGYVDVEGMLDITENTIYQLYIILEPKIDQCEVAEAGGLLIPALAIGSLIFFLLGKEKRKKLEDYEKYKEIYE